jgi:hypothetical protein
MNADMLNRGTEDHPPPTLSLSISLFFREGGANVPSVPPLDPPLDVREQPFNPEWKVVFYSMHIVLKFLIRNGKSHSILCILFSNEQMGRDRILFN